MTGKFHPNRKICSAFKQQLCYRKTPIPILRYRVENRGLPTDTALSTVARAFTFAPRSRSSLAASTSPTRIRNKSGVSTILVTNFSLPNGQTSQYGMQLANELSREMIAQQNQFLVVDRNLLQNILIKDRIPAKSIQGGVLHFLGAALNARFVVIGTTTKTGDDAVQPSAEIFDLTDKD